MNDLRRNLFYYKSTSRNMTQYRLKRVYDEPSPNDGFRVYIDRLWPRGLSHETFHYDLWEKDIAPSTELREWFHADPTKRWPKFKSLYIAELSTNQSFAALSHLLALKDVVTLLYSSRDSEHNNAVVVYNLLSKD